MMPPGFIIDNPIVNIFILFLLNYLYKLPGVGTYHFSWVSLYFARPPLIPPAFCMAPFTY